MNLIQSCIRHPVSTTVGVLFLILFGVVALINLPIQLAPDVDKPEITVTTIWPGASPLEIERDIIDEQEEELKSLEGLVRMRSESRDGIGVITLRFQVGTDKDAVKCERFAHDDVWCVPIELSFEPEASAALIALVLRHNEERRWISP